MKKHLFLTAMMMAALTLLWGCHHSGNHPDPDPDPEPGPGPVDPTPSSPWLSVSEIPVWEIDWSSNDPRPDWKDPDISAFESWMIIRVKVPNDIDPYVSDEDMMAVFINDELRGLSTVASYVYQDAETAVGQYFIVKAYGNLSTDIKEKFSIRYYNSKLHQLFAVEDEAKFVPEGDYGVTNNYVPPLLLGASKYPVIMDWGVRFSIDQEQVEPLVPTPGDLVAAFVDGECRGGCIIGGSLFNAISILTVYSKQEGEQVTLKYYSVSKKAIRVFDNVTTTRKGNKVTQISI